jgi:hypothetical protein
VFHIDITKVDLDVTMIAHVCCKRLSQCFIYFQTYVASVFI